RGDGEGGSWLQTFSPRRRRCQYLAPRHHDRWGHWSVEVECLGLVGQPHLGFTTPSVSDHNTRLSVVRGDAGREPDGTRGRAGPQWCLKLVGQWEHFLPYFLGDFFLG